jgi:hypothetical protein
LASLIRCLHSSLFAAYPFPCSQVVICLSILSEASLRFSEHKFFSLGWGCQPHAQPPTWRTRVSLFVWASTFDLCGMGDPAISYPTAGLALCHLTTQAPPLRQSSDTWGGGALPPSLPNIER